MNSYLPCNLITFLYITPVLAIKFNDEIK